MPVAAAMLVETWGHHAWVIRLLALGALLGVAGIVATIVRIETASATLALASAGLVLTGLVAVGGQPGAAGPESLMLALVLAAFLSLRTIPGARGAALAALLVSAACLTQHQAIGFAVAALVYLALEGRLRLSVFVLGMALFGGGAYVLLSHLLGPWFNFYAWDVPVRSVSFAPVRMLEHLGGHVVGTLGTLTLATVVSLALPAHDWRRLWLSMSAAALTVGLIASQTSSGVPLAAVATATALALIGPIAMKHVTGHLSAWPGSKRMGGESVMLAALALQFVALFARISPPTLLAGG
jgi:hypothetical protein